MPRLGVIASAITLSVGVTTPRLSRPRSIAEVISNRGTHARVVPLLVTGSVHRS